VIGSEPIVAYRMPGMGLTRLELGRDSLVAGQPRRGYRERTIPISSIEGFCVERMEIGGRIAGFNGDFVIVFRVDEKRRIYRLAVDADSDAFAALVAALGTRCPEVDFSRLPIADALARLQVPSQTKEVVKVLALVAAGFAIIVLIMLILWRRAH
jgi:hypothetical protein